MPQTTDHSSLDRQVLRGKRPAGSRVVPAIPLSFGKPKVARPQQKPGSEQGLAVQTASAAPAKGSVKSQSKDGGMEEAVPVVKIGTPIQDSGTADEERTEIVQTSVSHSSKATPIPNDADLIQPPTAVYDSPPGSLLNGREGELESPVTTSPQTSRKPTERFDIRQIRTELPPAFIPSAEQRTPNSAASSQQISLPPGLTHAHPHRPSMSSIVFGSQNSTASSPAPPLENGSAFAPPPMPPRPSHYGHAHQVSEPPPQRLSYQGHPQPTPPWAVRQGFASPSAAHPSYHPHAHMPMRYPTREPFHPSGVPHPNGYGPSYGPQSRPSSTAPDGRRFGTDLYSPSFEQSVESGRTMPPDARNGFPTYMAHRPPHSQNNPPLPLPPPDILTSIENAESLRDHVLSHCADPDLADCQLQVSDGHIDTPQYVDGHRIVLFRSPTLASLIRDSGPTTPTSLRPKAEVRLDGPYLRVRAFTDAVRYLYGGPLPTIDNVPGSFSEAQIGPNEERMDLALQQIATAVWLRIAAIGHRGVDLAASLLQWDTVCRALAFAIDGGLGHMWVIDDGSEEQNSSCSSDDSMTKPEAGGSPTYDPYATNLLHRILDFIVHTFPSNFYLDAAAPQLPFCARLPAAPLGHQSKSSRSDPRLSKIRFGEIPIEDLQRPSFVTTTISSILLSLPFPLLKFLLEHPDLVHRLGAETVASIMRQVVNEREVRRQKALKTRVVGHTEDGIDGHAISNLYWEEHVEPSNMHRAGFRLMRKRRGIDTPPSSGAESERTKV